MWVRFLFYFVDQETKAQQANATPLDVYSSSPAFPSCPGKSYAYQESENWGMFHGLCCWLKHLPRISEIPAHRGHPLDAYTNDTAVVDSLIPPRSLMLLLRVFTMRG